MSGETSIESWSRGGSRASLHAGAAATLLLLAACGGAAPPVPSAPSPPASSTLAAPAATAPSGATSGESREKRRGRDKTEVATGDTLTEYQKKRLLGHYSTRDGGSGFILDRTVTPWRAKLDGVPKWSPMSESSGPSDTKEYRTDTIWIRVDNEGNVLLFQGPKQTDGVRVSRDADAEQLK